jgi:hypothetical protein
VENLHYELTEDDLMVRLPLETFKALSADASIRACLRESAQLPSLIFDMIGQVVPRV